MEGLLVFAIALEDFQQKGYAGERSVYEDVELASKDHHPASTMVSRGFRREEN